MQHAHKQVAAKLVRTKRIRPGIDLKPLLRRLIHQHRGRLEAQAQVSVTRRIVRQQQIDKERQQNQQHRHR